MPDLPRVFTLVLNHQHAEDTLRCLASLRQSTYRNQFPIVIDNASQAAVRERLRGALPATVLLESEQNLGYAGGNNLGVTYALERQADMVWILNPDTSVDADALEHLITTAERHPEAGILGSRVLYGASRPTTISSDGGRIDWDSAGGVTNIHDGVPESEVAGEGSHTVDYVTGSSMLIRREVFEDIGLLPEEYFLYFEETDFAVRARNAGWDARVDVRSRVHHYKRSFGQVPAPYYIYYYIRGRLLFAHRHGEVPLEDVEADLDPFILGWRDRVAANAPSWLEEYDALVDRALADGWALRGGRADEIHEMSAPRAGA